MVKTTQSRVENLDLVLFDYRAMAPPLPPRPAFDDVLNLSDESIGSSDCLYFTDDDVSM